MADEPGTRATCAKPLPLVVLRSMTRSSVWSLAYRPSAMPCSSVASSSSGTMASPAGRVAVLPLPLVVTLAVATGPRPVGVLYAMASW